MLKRTGVIAIALTSFGIPRVAGAQTFTNATAITIPATGTGTSTGGPATPYPSNISVSGLTVPIGRVSITLNGLSHTFPDDLDVLLVAPDGAKLIVLSDAGDTNDAVGLNLTFSDQTLAALPDAGPFGSGTYRPRNYGTLLDPFPAPAPSFLAADSPAPGGTATFASQFKGHDGNGTWSLYIVDDANGDTGAIAGGWSITFAPATAAAPGDFDYDGIGDLPLYNVATGDWKILRSSAPAFTASLSINWGGPGYTPVPGDYDGDGALDAAVYNESTGLWSILKSSSGNTAALSISWGGVGYVPVPGDYDGDLATDIAIYNATTSNWYVLTSASGFTSSILRSWGGVGYTPVGGQDFDGDHRADFTIYQEALGNWYVLKSSTGYTTVQAIALGGPGSILVPGDYDGDGKADAGVYNRGSNIWTTRTSSSGFASGPTRTLGGLGTVPVSGYDFDGDHKADIAIRQAATFGWIVATSSSSYANTEIHGLGTAADTPLVEL